MKALLVTKREQMRRRLREALRAHGFEVSVCAGVGTARTACVSGGYRLIVLDGGLRAKDGVRLCQAAHDWVRGHRSVLVFICCSPQRPMARALLDAGADDCLFDVDDARALELRLECATRLSRAQQQLLDSIESTRRQEAELARVLRTTNMTDSAADLAHEISQPVAAIKAYTAGGKLRMETGRSDPKDLREAFDRIEAQALHAERMLERVRAFIRKREPQREATDVNELIQETVQLAEPQARRKNVPIRLKLSSLPSVYGDRVQLQQVVFNLVTNGIDAMEPEGDASAELAISTELCASGTIEVSVVDRGHGLGASESRLFEPFFTTKKTGLGMGLPISRSIVEAHGGQLWATVNRERGTTFHFTLPAAVQGTAAAA